MGEAQESAKIAEATLHHPIVDDGLILYDKSLLQQTAAVIRRIRPNLLLVPSPEDYMEDHQNTARLLVTAAFTREMPHFKTEPEVEPWSGDVTLYHSLPHGLHDGMRRRVLPEHYANIEAVMDQKRQMLACHKSQEEWLDISQSITHLTHMKKMDRQVGEMSGRFRFAEGWRRHLHLGLSAKPEDPVADLLGGDWWTDPRYGASL